MKIEGYKNCNHCGLYLPPDAFNWKNQVLGIRHKTCRNCQSEHQKQWYEKHKDTHKKNVLARKVSARQEARQFVLEYLSMHPCVQCGESDPMVLEFHHLGGKEKEISFMITGGYPIAKIQSEIVKCQVLCANCHRRRTVQERGWFRNGT